MSFISISRRVITSLSSTEIPLLTHSALDFCFTCLFLLCLSTYVVERFAMLGIREKDIRRCHKTLRNELMKSLDGPRTLVVHSLEIWSPDRESEDPEGSCYIKWDITLSLV